MKREVDSVNKKNDYEIEEYFKDVKKKSFPLGILFGIIFLVLIGGGCFYYFVIDSPKALLVGLVKNRTISLGNGSYNNYNSFKIDGEFNFVTNNSDYIDIVNVLNKMAFKSEMDVDFDSKKMYTYLDVMYDDKSLVDLYSYYDDDYVYVKSDRIFDKVLKSKISSENDVDSSNEGEDFKEYQDILRLVFNNWIKAMEDGKYTKKYKKIDDSFVKEIMLTIDRDFLEKFYTNLLNDDEFIESYSLLNGISESELKESINKSINDLGNDYMDIVIDLSVIKNEFIKLEILYDKDRIVIEKDREDYFYKYYDNSIIMYQGSFKLLKEDNNYEIYISVDLVEDDLVIEFSGDISLELKDVISKIDVSDAVILDDMTDDDYSKMLDNINNNQVLSDFLEDIYGDLDDVQKS